MSTQAANGVPYADDLTAPAGGKILGYVYVENDGSRRIAGGNRPEREPWSTFLTRLGPIIKRTEQREDVTALMCDFSHASWGYTLSADGLIYEGPTPYEDGEYFTYDFGHQSAPVNQVPKLLEWRATLARFAHELDVWHTARHTGDADNLTNEVVEDLVISQIGHVWSQMSIWAGYNPQLTTGARLVWEATQPYVAGLMAKVCSACEIRNYPRQLRRNIDALAFRRRINLGKIDEVDMTTDPWSVGGLIAAHAPPADGATGAAKPITEASAAVIEYLDDLEAKYNEAIDYYDTQLTD